MDLSDYLQVYARKNHIKKTDVALLLDAVLVATVNYEVKDGSD